MANLEDIIHQENIQDYKAWFDSIADTLLKEYIIKTKDNQYQITEIEFYYYSILHPDKATYGFMNEGKQINDRLKRIKQLQCKTLTWFFHYSGIDLVFGRNNEPGGILIRSITNTTSEEDISGPLKVQLELLSQTTSVFESTTVQPHLEKSKMPFLITIETQLRKGIRYGGLQDEHYNYSSSK